MSDAASLLARHGAELAVAVSTVLGLGAFAVAVTRSPLHRQKLAELTLVVALAGAALLLVPLPRPGAHWIDLERKPATPAPPAAALGVKTRAPSARSLAPAPSSRPTPRPFTTPIFDETPWQGPAETPIESAELLSNVAPPPSLDAGVPSETLANVESQVEPQADAASGAQVRAWVRWFALGAFAFAAHLALSSVLLFATLRRAKRAPQWVEALGRERRRAPRRLPRVLVASGVSRPFCCGIGRGTIVLPAALVRPELAARLETVLRHERAHVAQRHPRARLIAALGAPLFFWQPLYWWLARELRQNAELVADDMAIEGFDKRCYVEELLELAAHSAPIPANPIHRALWPQASRLGVLGSKKDFMERMEKLLMRRSQLATRSSRRHVAARSLCACLLLGSVSVAWGRPLQDAAATSAGPGRPSGLPTAGAQNVPAFDVPIAVAADLEAFDVPIAVAADFDAFDVPRAVPERREELDLAVIFETSNPTALGHFLMLGGDVQVELTDGDTGSGQRRGHAVFHGVSTTAINELSRIPGLSVLKVSVNGGGEGPATSPFAGAGAGGVGRAPGGRRGAASTSSGLRNEIDQLRAQVGELAQLYRNLQVTQASLLAYVGQSRDAGSNPILGLRDSAGIDGQVLSISKSNGSGGSYVTIDCGTEAGVREEMVLDVYRGSTYKGRVRVLQTSEGFSVATIVNAVAGRSIELGDKVTDRLSDSDSGGGGGSR